MRSFTGADLRARRLALGLFDVGTSGAVLNESNFGIEGWESNFRRDDLETAITRIERVEVIADQITADLVGQSRKTGTIITYRGDDAAHAAALRIPIASMHRVCAGRAAERNPEATLLVADLDEGPGASVEARSELLVRMTMLGLSTRSPIALGIDRRALQKVMAGKQELRQDRFDQLASLEAAAVDHLDAIEDRLEAAAGIPTVPMATTVRDLLNIYPTAAVPVETHQFLVGELLRSDPELRATWIHAPASPVDHARAQRAKARNDAAAQASAT